MDITVWNKEFSSMFENNKNFNSAGNGDIKKRNIGTDKISV